MPQTSDSPAVAPTVRRLKKIIAHRPLCLGIETINICNARCAFCAYRKMQRPKRVLEQEVFEKAVNDYAELGGGAIRLTPTMGEVLLDPLLLERLRFLRSRPEIGQVYLVTNGIVWDRFSADQQRFILESIAWMGFSLGGLDAGSYKEMYGVDGFEKVRSAIHRVCELKARHNLRLEIHLSFRAARSLEELSADPRMEEFRRLEIDQIKGGNLFLNWGGMVRQDELPPGAHLRRSDPPGRPVSESKKHPCFMLYLEPTISSSGLVSACGCQDAEAAELILGDIRRQHLGELWNGEVSNKLKASFGTEDLPAICRVCTLYTDGEAYLRHPGLEGFVPGEIPYLGVAKHRAEHSASVWSKAPVELQQQGGA